jgi:CxxC motif-containing protein/thioredoxin reductase
MALTGPEYAERALREAMGVNVEIYTSRHVSEIKNCSEGYIVAAYTQEGIEEYLTKTIVLATGCRERTRGNISIPGSRPAGIFTAGVAQNLINVRNVMIGKRVVILGSGDIGLIMARRLTLEGAQVLAIAEIMPEPTGLARNVSQCVYEYNIPLYVRTTVSNIIGKQKLEAVELAEVDENNKVIPGTSRRIECDSLVLSVGLIPENEVALTAGVTLHSNNTVVTDSHLQTSVKGIFSCGNSRHVMDLADYVSEQGEMAGRNAVRLINGEAMESWDEGKVNLMKKGFPQDGVVTCTVCPNGCQVQYDEKSDSFFGNKCPRGASFARQERSNPKRTVTTTVKSQKGLVSVKSAEAVDKDIVPAVVKALKKVELNNIVKCGDEIFNGTVLDRTVRIISTSNT